MKRKVVKGISLLLVMAMLISFCCVSGFALNKKQTSRTIGIVFDNSGSMYISSAAWCRATYAIEVIAAMMNDGDCLQVYPMNDVQVGGTTYSQNTPLTINSAAEATKIRDIYTPDAEGTPIESITAAYNGLSKTTTDEKWLIVLTDGQTFYRDEKELTDSATQSALTDLLNNYANSMNVFYLGIGSKLKAPTVKGGTSYQFGTAVAASSEEVLSKLTEVCNTIFGRDILPVSGNTLDIDLTLSKLIVFVQGNNISNVTLKNSGGQALTASASYSAKYSDKGSGNYDIETDTSLQGQLMTYTELDADKYTLSYSGDMSSIGVYYEPDVDLKLSLVDENGNEVTPGTNYAGDYTLEYTMVDRDGNETTSSLLGNVTCDLTYDLSGETETVQSTVPGSIPYTLEAGDTLDGEATVSFLSGYSVTQSFQDMGWPEGGIEITPRPAGLLEAFATSTTEDVKLSNMQEASIADLSLYYENEEVTKDQLSNASLLVEVEGGNAEAEVRQTDAGLSVWLKPAEDATTIECGDYIVHVTPTYTNEDGQVAYGETMDFPFTIRDDSRGLALDVKADQSYYQISKMDEGEPIMAYLTRDGEALTAEELDQVTMKVEAEGLDFEVTPNYEESAYEIMPLKTENTEAGKYEINVTATGADEVGRPLTEEDSAKIELRGFPKWVRTAAICLAILLLLLLIWLYLNMKVLPKKIFTPKCNFTVDGEPIPGKAECKYNRKGGTLEVISPKYAANNGVKCGYSLKLKAVSPRRVTSANRSVQVVDIKPLNGKTDKVQISAVSMIRDDETRKFMRQGGKTLQPFEINSNARTSAHATVEDPTTGEMDVFFSTNLKFK